MKLKSMHVSLPSRNFASFLRYRGGAPPQARKRCGLRCRPVAGSACGSRGPRRRRRAGTWPGAPSGSCELRHRRAEWSSAAASVWALRRWESPAPSRISAAPAVVPAPGTQILFPATTHTNASSKNAALVEFGFSDGF